jgi:hypothetical protein
MAPAGLRPGDGRVDRRADRALRLPRPRLGRAAAEVYTDITLDRVLRRAADAAIFDDALADTSPLFEHHLEYLDERMLAAIAQGHGQGGCC